MSVLPPNPIVLSKIYHYLLKKLAKSEAIYEPEKKPFYENGKVVLEDNPDKGKLVRPPRDDYPDLPLLLNILGPWPVFKIKTTFKKAATFEEKEISQQDIDQILYKQERDREFYTDGPTDDIDKINYSFTRIKKEIKDRVLGNGVITLLLMFSMDGGNKWNEYHYDHIEVSDTRVSNLSVDKLSLDDDNNPDINGKLTSNDSEVSNSLTH